MTNNSFLSGGLVEHLPAGVFDTLTQVTMLKLFNMYRLQELPADVFSNMESLDELEFRDCAIWSFHPHAFRGLTSVTELYVETGQPRPRQRSRLASRTVCPLTFRNCTRGGVTPTRLLDMPSVAIEASWFTFVPDALERLTLTTGGAFIPAGTFDALANLAAFSLL